MIIIDNNNIIIYTNELTKLNLTKNFLKKYMYQRSSSFYDKNQEN